MNNFDTVRMTVGDQFMQIQPLIALVLESFRVKRV